MIDPVCPARTASGLMIPKVCVLKSIGPRSFSLFCPICFSLSKDHPQITQITQNGTEGGLLLLVPLRNLSSLWMISRQAEAYRTFLQCCLHFPADVSR